VHVSRAGVLRQRSVFGGAERVKDPIHCGISSTEKFRGMKESLVGGGMPSPEGGADQWGDLYLVSYEISCEDS